MLRAAWRDWLTGERRLIDLVPYENAAILADGHSIDGAPPKLRHIGPAAPAVKIFGETWRKAVNAGNAPRLPAHDFDEVLSKDYFDAADHEPKLSEAAYTFVHDGRRIRVCFERLIVPVHMPGFKWWFLVSLIEDIERPRIDPLH